MAVADSGIRAVSQELMEELMGAVVAIDFVLQTLMDLPADAPPREGQGRSDAGAAYR